MFVLRRLKGVGVEVLNHIGNVVESGGVVYWELENCISLIVQEEVRKCKRDMENK